MQSATCKYSGINSFILSHIDTQLNILQEAIWKGLSWIYNIEVKFSGRKFGKFGESIVTKTIQISVYNLLLISSSTKRFCQMHKKSKFAKLSCILYPSYGRHPDITTWGWSFHKVTTKSAKCTSLEIYHVDGTSMNMTASHELNRWC